MKKSGSVGIVVFLMGGVMFLWESLGWWLIIIPAAIIAVWVFYSWLNLKKDKQNISLGNESTVSLDINMGVGQRDYSAPYERTDHDGERYFFELQDLLDKSNYDEVRKKLRQFAWSTHRYSTPMFKARLADFISEFAKIDPIFKRMWPIYEEFIQVNSGVMQSKIYSLFPNESKDDQRYVLYFAEHLNLLRREKSGNSYKLFIPNKLIDSDVVVIDDLNAVEIQMLSELLERKYICLPLNKYWSRHLADPESSFKKMVAMGYFQRADDVEIISYFFKKPELVEMLKAQNLPSSGNKDILISRVIENFPDFSEKITSEKDLYKPVKRC
ncbi:SAP domain-containing protein [Neisseria dumasiana]|nr:SAP domain-containing protein [Neisseria dumasiana]